MKAVFIYNFTKYFEWSNLSNRNDFRIALVGADSLLVKEFKNLASEKKVGQKEISVLTYDGYTPMMKIGAEVLYVNMSKYPNYDFSHDMKNTLVVSDNGKDLDNAMIAFTYIQGMLKFAVNKVNIQEAGFLKMHPDFEMLASAVIRNKSEYKKNRIEHAKWENVFEKLKSSVTGDKKEVAFTKKEIEEVVGKFSAQTNEISTQKQKALINEIEIRDQKRLRNISIGFIILFMILSGFIFKSLQQNKKQNKIITAQKEEVEKQNHVINKQKQLVEEKHREITDSINYAERIQRSFLATKELLNKNLKDYFVFFKPKDVVSGDFYWAERFSNGNFILVTADSTGHGVPGAIMSILNITSLEKAIENNTQPADILNAARKTIIERLKKDGSAEGGKDGMDCSLLMFDSKNKKLIIAAANNPVWIVCKATQTNAVTSSSDGGGVLTSDVTNSRSEQSSTRTDIEVLEIKPNKMPVGKHDKQDVSFTQQEINLQSGDVIYCLTDGFADQFGGPNGKKFMSKNLRELLSTNSHLSMQEQKQLLESTFTNWIGNIEQVDDITVIGIRV
ncbi:YfiR/HmsC family protein [Aurantibacillus circumpalustris]|uniref:YfiR/HmsC family protein n=1 Tax=Aurantibacillus circumpalustris TaxID=3036359 RepID=UPI00295AB182|nr:YfiR/HmsC family protein [Aurantibacillus circumpalustris]